jgi:dTDP-4-amino-4,6-dideoxygalactose transaminase
MTQGIVAQDNYLPYFKPSIDEDDIRAVTECLRRGWLTTGPVVKEFEQAFVSMSGIPHAVAVNSCTAALHLALAALGVGPGDEVIMPALTFVAGAECVRSLGADPVFCDVDAQTLCVTRETIEPLISPRTKVIMTMDYGGQPCGIESICVFAHARGIAVVEDAAHALGTLDGGQWPGYYSDAAAYSFYATKNITSAEGGLLLTRRDDIAEKARILSLHGMDRDAWKRYTKDGSWSYDVLEVGYKYNLSDMAAALGLSQLRKLSALQRRREDVARRYLDGLTSINGLKSIGCFPSYPDQHSWCLFAVAVEEEVAGFNRNVLIEKLRDRRISTSVHFIPTHQFSAYRNAKRGQLTNTDRMWQRIISLPLYPGLQINEVEHVLQSLRHVISSETGRIRTTG